MPISHFVQIQSFEQAMSKALAMVRRHLNSHNPTIRRIPSEILIMIASHLKVDAAFITKATHVCHHWRITLLSCPDLWTYPDFTRGSQALSFLDRSKPFPIHVDLTKTNPSKFLADLIYQHAERVDTLKISRFDGFQELFHHPMASLKTLAVDTPDSWLFAYNVRPATREFPALTSLTVKYNPGALAFRGALITHLRVAISGLSLEVMHLTGLLQSCVLLEKLELENKGELESGLRLLPDEVIPLPHLRSFTQTLHWDRHAAGIINHLDLPPSCSIDLRCIAGPTNGCPSLDLPDLRDASYLTNLKRLKVVHAGGCLGSEAGFTLDFINDRGTRFTATIDFINFAVSPQDKDREHPKDDRIEASMPGIEVLCVDGNRYVPMENCSSLTTLILSGTIVHLYLDLLVESDGHDAYKNLHTLVLFVVPGRFTPNPVRCLPEVAQTRAQAGLPLKAITVAYPSELASYDLEVLEELRAYVERVELLLEDDTLDWNLDKYFLN
jgi:hypothetical protein